MYTYIHAQTRVCVWFLLRVIECTYACCNRYARIIYKHKQTHTINLTLTRMQYAIHTLAAHTDLTNTHTLARTHSYTV